MKICTTTLYSETYTKAMGTTFCYKNAKQKEAFDNHYKFLHFGQPSLTRLRKMAQNYESIECVRCNRADETQKHWLFSCSSSDKVIDLAHFTSGPNLQNYNSPN